MAEPPPVGVVEPIEIVQARLLIAMECIQAVVIEKVAALVGAVPAGHRVADVVAPYGDQQIQVSFQAVGAKVRVVEQIVLIRPANQQHRFALVLPVAPVLGPGLNPTHVLREAGELIVQFVVSASLNDHPAPLGIRLAERYAGNGQPADNRQQQQSGCASHRNGFLSCGESVWFRMTGAAAAQAGHLARLSRLLAPVSIQGDP
jgi:hypothetical protein